MITLINGTNSASRCADALMSVYKNYLTQLEQDFLVLDLRDMPTQIISEDMYYNRAPDFQAWQEKYLFDSQLFIIVVPEYNGSIPGIFKLMVDASDIQRAWWGKKACLTGFSMGRAGNLRGLGHLTNILNYLKINVHYNTLPISKIKELVDENRKLVHAETIQSIHQQVDQFLAF